MSLSYQEPTWAHPPPSEYEWSIEEIKGGVLLASHRLTLSCTTFGRAADMVTIPTAHESCSRLHARIAFDKDGVPWLRDLGSGHGTTVNKRPLPRKAAGKGENGTGEGSRGVIIYPGDVVQFGASTRMFCVVGPAEFDRGAIRLKKKTRMTEEQARTMIVNSPQSSKEESPELSSGVSWGIDMDEHPENDDDDNGQDQKYLPPLEQLEILERYRKSYEKLMAKKYKLSNLQRESERIRRKAASEELSAGQTAQLEKNEEREVVLQREVEDLEMRLRRKLDGRSQAEDKAPFSGRKKEREEKYHSDEDSDVDDFFDRTISKKRTKHEVEEETEQSLIAKWGGLHSSLQRRNLEVSQAQNKVDKLEKRVIAANEMDEDAFFIKNEIELAKDELQRTINVRDEVEKELNGVEKLLRIVNNKLVFDRELGVVGEQSAFSAVSSAKDPSRRLHGSSSNELEENSTSIEMPPPAATMPVTTSLPTASSVPQPPLPDDTVEKSTGFFMPPPPRKPLIGPSLGPLRSPERTGKNDTENQKAIPESDPASKEMPPPLI